MLFSPANAFTFGSVIVVAPSPSRPHHRPDNNRAAPMSHESHKHQAVRISEQVQFSRDFCACLVGCSCFVLPLKFCTGTLFHSPVHCVQCLFVFCVHYFAFCGRKYPLPACTASFEAKTG